MRSTIPLAYFLILFGFGLLPAQDITSMAILDFEGKGVSSSEASSLTDWLRTEVMRLGTITLVERGTMMERLRQEQELGLLGCTSDKCVIQIGKELQVSHMVSGTIGKVGLTYTITAKTVSVETGEIISIVSRRHKGQVDQLFDEIPGLAREIVGTRVKAEIKRQEEQQRAREQAAVRERKRQQEEREAQLRSQRKQVQKQQYEALLAKKRNRANFSFILFGAMAGLSNKNPESEQLNTAAAISFAVWVITGIDYLILKVK